MNNIAVVNVGDDNSMNKSGVGVSCTRFEWRFEDVAKVDTTSGVFSKTELHKIWPIHSRRSGMSRMTMCQAHPTPLIEIGD